MQKVLITGHRGYIGVHLTSLLRQRGYHVVGCDLNLFEGCAIEPFTLPNEEWLCDFREISCKQLEGIQAIFHLAALSNDPMGDIDPRITYSINQEGSYALAKKAKEAKVPRFLFASSCSIYGQGEKLDLDESGAVNPCTPYAQSKILAEQQIQTLSDPSFCPIFLRSATAYGYSPMLRIDLVVNHFLACGFAKNEIRVMSDGSPWRPLIHCKDIARAFIACAEAPQSLMQNCVLNVGANVENYQVREVVEKASRLIPHAKVTYTGEVGQDPRNYRVDFTRLSQLLPSFRLEYTLSQGMQELFEKLRFHAFSCADFDGNRFIRLRALKPQMARLNFSAN